MTKAEEKKHFKQVHEEGRRDANKRAIRELQQGIQEASAMDFGGLQGEAESVLSWIRESITRASPEKPAEMVWCAIQNLAKAVSCIVASHSFGGNRALLYQASYYAGAADAQLFNHAAQTAKMSTAAKKPRPVRRGKETIANAVRRADSADSTASSGQRAQRLGTQLGQTVDPAYVRKVRRKPTKPA